MNLKSKIQSAIFILISGAVILFPFIVFAQTPIPLPCGQTITGIIADYGEIDSYTFSLSEATNVMIRGVRVSGGGLDVYLELYNAQETLIAGALNQIDTTLSAGAYTVKVKDDNNLDTGYYALFWQKWNTPCNTTPVICGQTVAGSISISGETDFYSFTATAGDTVVLTLTASRYGNNPYLYGINSYLELFNSSGQRIAAQCAYPITQTLSTGGTYFVLVSDCGYFKDSGGYTLKFQKNTNSCPQVTVTAPQGGEFLLPGSNFTITWTSTDLQGIASHEIRLSTDGGSTFPTIIASGLGNSVQSFNWNVPTGVSTAKARIRVIATDTSGNSTPDDSDADFVIAPGVRRIHVYDQLNRLIRIIYDDGE